MKTNVIGMLALALAPAISVEAQCPPRRYVTSGVDRFTGVTATRSNFLPAKAFDALLQESGGDFNKARKAFLAAPAGPTVANILAFTNASHKPPEYGVLLTTVSSALRYQSCFTSYILADDRPVVTLTTKYFDSVKVTDGYQGVGIGTAIPLGRLGFLGLAFNTSTSGSAVATETIGMTVDAEAVAQLGRASKIEFKTCNDTMVASSEFVQAAHEVACKVAQLSSGATPTLAPPPSASPPPGAPPFTFAFPPDAEPRRPRDESPITGSPAPVPVTAEIAGKRLESEQGPAFVWALTIRNTSPRPIAVVAVVQLVDAEGFEVARLAPERLSVEASSERVFRGKEPVAKEVADRVARLAVKLQVPAAQSTPVRPVVQQGSAVPSPAQLLSAPPPPPQ